MAATTRHEAVELLFYFRTASHPDNFTSLLYHLMAKADGENFARLYSAFPFEGEIFQQWRLSSDEQLFFEEHGFKISI